MSDRNSQTTTLGREKDIREATDQPRIAKRIKDRLIIWPEGTKSPVLAAENMSGMTVHRRVGRNRRGWTITHLKTGRSIATLASHEAAVMCMRRMARLGDWSRWRTGISIPKSLRQKARRMLAAHELTAHLRSKQARGRDAALERRRKRGGPSNG
jgi:hypothetical protein